MLKLVGNEAYVQAVGILPHIPEPDIIFGNIGGIPVRWASLYCLKERDKRGHRIRDLLIDNIYVALQRLISQSLRKMVSNARRYSVPAIVEVS